MKQLNERGIRAIRGLIETMCASKDCERYTEEVAEKPYTWADFHRDAAQAVSLANKKSRTGKGYSPKNSSILYPISARLSRENF